VASILTPEPPVDPVDVKEEQDQPPTVNGGTDAQLAVVNGDQDRASATATPIEEPTSDGLIPVNGEA